MSRDGNQKRDVVIIGKGVSGLSAGIFTARAGLDTLIVNQGGSILKRNAHLENYLGFPRGIDSRLFLRMGEEQAEWNGCEFRDGKVTDVTKENGVFLLETNRDETIRSEYVIAASWSDSSYLENLGVKLDQKGSKQFIRTEPDGRTSVEGLYGAGRIAEQYHQTIVSAGHGAKVALTLIEDAIPEYYHDWVAPEGYFTNRGREVPLGCEEIPQEERLKRDEKARQRIMDYVENPLGEEPVPHPSLQD